MHDNLVSKLNASVDLLCEFRLMDVNHHSNAVYKTDRIKERIDRRHDLKLVVAICYRHNFDLIQYGGTGQTCSGTFV